MKRRRTIGKAFFVIKMGQRRSCRSQSRIQNRNLQRIRKRCNWWQPVRLIAIHMLPDGRSQVRLNDRAVAESCPKSPRCHTDGEPADREYNDGHFPSPKHTLPPVKLQEQHGLRPHLGIIAVTLLMALMPGYLSYLSVNQRSVVQAEIIVR